MEKEGLKAEILFRLEDYNGSRKEAERLLRKYVQSVRKEMFTKDDLKAILYWHKVCEQEGLTDRHNDQAVKEKLTELLNLEEKGNETRFIQHDKETSRE